jgi:hypothetical protein
MARNHRLARIRNLAHIRKLVRRLAHIHKLAHSHKLAHNRKLAHSNFFGLDGPSLLGEAWQTKHVSCRNASVRSNRSRSKQAHIHKLARTTSWLTATSWFAGWLTSASWLDTASWLTAASICLVVITEQTGFSEGT